MRRAVREAFYDFTAPMEGVVPWMYSDVKGLVTTAVGNLIDPMGLAMPLPWRRPNGTPASSEEVAAEWLRVKSDSNAAKLGHRYTQRLTALRLTDEGVRELLHRKLDENDAALRRYYPDFEVWPADAQLATHSMAWACGPAFGEPGPRRFPRLAAALRAQDWRRAAAECRMDETGNPGLVPRNKANRVLYTNAAMAPDPALLYWPRDLSDEVPADAPTVPSFEIVRPTLYQGRHWEDDPDEPPPSAA